MKTEFKVFIGIGLLTVAVIAGGVFFYSNTDTQNTSVKDSEIITRSGLHWHTKLSIKIDGKKQEIPANIGIGAVHQKIHTHDDNKEGVIHMEMNGLVTKDDTRLGNFFRIWGKKFSSTQIFDKKNSKDKKVKMIVNGKENKEFENYHMRDKDNIEISFE